MHHAIPILYSIVLWPVTHAMHSGNLISRALNRRQDTGDRIVTLATIIKGPTKDPACDHLPPPNTKLLASQQFAVIFIDIFIFNP